MTDFVIIYSEGTYRGYCKYPEVFFSGKDVCEVADLMKDGINLFERSEQLNRPQDYENTVQR